MVKCPNCGTPATGNDVFCGSCGQRLPSQTAASAGAPAGAPVTDPPPLPPMPGPPSGSQPGYTSPPQQPQVVQPTYQPPVTPSYTQSQPQQPAVVQPSYGQAAPVYGQQPPGGQPPRKKSNGCLIAIIVIVVLALCGALIVGGAVLIPEIIDSGNPTTTPFDNGNTTNSNSGEAPLDVVNNLNVSICYLYISPSTSDEWGEDWLWDIGTIEPGFAAMFSLPVGETVDMQAEDCNGNILDNQYEVYIPPEGLTYTLNP